MHRTVDILCHEFSRVSGSSKCTKIVGVWTLKLRPRPGNHCDCSLADKTVELVTSLFLPCLCSLHYDAMLLIDDICFGSFL